MGSNIVCPVMISIGYHVKWGIFAHSKPTVRKYPPTTGYRSTVCFYRRGTSITSRPAKILNPHGIKLPIEVNKYR